MKYIVLGNTAQWCVESWQREISQNKDLLFINDAVPCTQDPIVQKLCRIHNSHKFIKRELNRMTWVWYPNYVKRMGLSEVSADEPIILLMYDWNRISVDFGFLDHLRKKFRNIAIAYIFTNIVEKSGANYFGIADKLKDHYDIVFAFDRLDARRCGFAYSPLIYGRNDSAPEQEAEVDLFYVGQAKNRLEDLYAVYDAARRDGLRCEFHIVGVEEHEKRDAEGIVYNQYMAYTDVLERVKRAKCIVDATQKNSSGLTIKVCEAVFYGKKIISTNPAIRQEAFYDESRIFTFHDERRCIGRFLREPMNPYTREELKQFSADHLWERICAMKDWPYAGAEGDGHHEKTAEGALA